jgi:hypothetical protein
MHPGWRAVSHLARRLDHVPGGLWAGRAAYRAAARIAAGVLARIPDVDGVYAVGSLTRPATLKPGKSDLDLVVVANLPTLQSELRLRERLRRAHRVLHAALPVFQNLDYFDVSDLPYLRNFGDAWTLDLDRRWRCMAGENRLAEPPQVPPAERRSELLTICLKRWMKASPRLLDAARPDDEASRREIARRLLMDALSALLDCDRLTPLEDLWPAARAELQAPYLRREPDELDVESSLAVTLDILDHMARSASGPRDQRWAVSGHTPNETLPQHLESSARRFVEEGFASVALVRRGARAQDRLLLAVARSDTAPREILRAVGRAQRGMPPLGADDAWQPRPVALTPALFRAAAHFSPAPLLGAQLASLPAWHCGDPPEAALAPPARALRSSLARRTATLFLRRLMRTRRDSQSFHAELVHELEVIAPALARAFDAGTFDPFFPSWEGRTIDEAGLVARRRRFIDERKPMLDDFARQRESAKAQSEGT